MKKLGIIQPGRIGDIIICLPIAKWYNDNGYEIVWPIHDIYMPHFKDYIDYVNFIGINDLNCNSARIECIKVCNMILDLSITMPFSNNINDQYFMENKLKLSFDEVKYLIANVPFEKKWDLIFKRNFISEKKLESNFNDLYNKNYTLVHNKGSSESFVYNPAPGENVIYVSELTGSIFDWYSIILKSNKIIAIDSSFSNLVEQLGYNGPKFLIRRSADIRPIYKSWKII